MTSEAFLVCIGAAVVVAFLLLRYWLRSPVRSVEKYIRQLETGERPDIPDRSDYEHEILLSEAGFIIRGFRDPSESTGLLPWQSITQVSAYKLDLVTTDQVRLSITFDHAGSIEAHEEMKGFTDLCEALAERVSGFPSFWTWITKVRTPAFETCLTRLYPPASA